MATRRLLLPAAPLAVLVARALRVRLSVAPWGRYWGRRALPGAPLVVALGDSLTVGTGTTRASRSWLALFVGHVEATWGTTVAVDNRAVYGARVADVLRDQLPLPADAILVTLCIGSNDAGRSDPERFRADLRTLVAQLPPGSVVGDVPEFRWGPRVPAAAELSRVVCEVVAERPDLLLAPVEEHTTGVRILTGLAGDFFHPNDRTHRRIADAFVTGWSQRRVLDGPDPRR
ncbi:SGNH/GDSL hydrolase family protein [Nostocoides sp. Soil756]|jgi:lysophospholipase L1-like esterase|uniref:SGNH/GDSL hydrolase family protein n=1 Tax=Nostocoides sp. Soil756 TaxID=1736399 RepID=UPI0007013EAC|nr:SGNH/GDSL hydrolase family protein [Tetrasphaera sp. Soil756]KRE62963.1 hypothetical protein ASG78_08400 [Tetrasphaera sp. Soil756]